MTFNPHTAQDREEMLASVGVATIDELFAGIPADIRRPDLHLPRALTEMEAAARMSELAAKNMQVAPGDSFLGAGSYSHYVPAVVNQILLRGEFFTAYTPYQPEVAQGTLQVIYEFQTMVAALLGTEVANASLYDGATAVAEAVLMAIATQKKRDRIVITSTVHPHYRDVLSTYVSGRELEITTAAPPALPELRTSVDNVKAQLGDDVACVVLQYPNFFGAIEDVKAIADAAHEAGALVIVSTLPVPLGVLVPPGELGADIVTAEGQSLGVAQSFGGPYVGLLGARKSFVRQMPGRLCGIATDAEGKRGFVLTLQTREQHIRREKATSNICTNQGLMATAATVYMATLGPQGFREVAERAFQNAHHLADRLDALDGFDVVRSGDFFMEFVVKTKQPPSKINKHLALQGIVGGLDLGRYDEAMAGHMLFCATELNDAAAIDRLVAALETIQE
jgi:glycine dehydrogenase subunit 1